jgi:hypothetical protein
VAGVRLVRRGAGGRHAMLQQDRLARDPFLPIARPKDMSRLTRCPPPPPAPPPQDPRPGHEPSPGRPPGPPVSVAAGCLTPCAVARGPPCWCLPR